MAAPFPTIPVLLGAGVIAAVFLSRKKAGPAAERESPHEQSDGVVRPPGGAPPAAMTPPGGMTPPASTPFGTPPIGPVPAAPGSVLPPNGYVPPGNPFAPQVPQNPFAPQVPSHFPQVPGGGTFTPPGLPSTAAERDQAAIRRILGNIPPHYNQPI